MRAPPAELGSMSGSFLFSTTFLIGLTGILLVFGPRAAGHQEGESSFGAVLWKRVSSSSFSFYRSTGRWPRRAAAQVAPFREQSVNVIAGGNESSLLLLPGWALPGQRPQLAFDDVFQARPPRGEQRGEEEAGQQEQADPNPQALERPVGRRPLLGRRDLVTGRVLLRADPHRPGSWKEWAGRLPENLSRMPVTDERTMKER